MKRVNAAAFAALIIILITASAFLCACAADNTEVGANAAPIVDTSLEPSAASDSIAVQPTAAPSEKSDKFNILALLINDDGSDRAYMTMYGFLHTAENLGYPSKVLRVKNAEEAEASVKTAHDEGITALVVFDPNGEYQNAVMTASKLGMKTAATYYASNSEGIDTSVTADDADFFDELARGIAERMTERDLKSGRILVYGRDTQKCESAFNTAINEYYPQFHVASFKRTAVNDEEATEELAQFLLHNRDIKGMYVIDSDSSAVAVNARSKAQSLFKSGAATATPTFPVVTPTPESTTKLEHVNATPAYTPNPAIMNAISVTVFCSGLSADNYSLFSDNDIYALCIEPYYEASAQAAMMLDKLLGGDDCAVMTKVNRPIVYADTADKYKAIYDQMRYMFGLD